jgi:uncharacterized DUF497 family protein
MNYTVTTGDLSFEWDVDKASLNESASEDPFILLGIGFETRLILVCHCYRGDGDVVRIISARLATRGESQNYMAGVH